MKSILFFIIIPFFNSLYGQTYRGYIINENNSPVNNASVILWNNQEKVDLIKYTFTNESGEFVFEVPTNQKSFFIEVISINYEKYSLSITDLKKEIIIVLKKSEIQLDEVKILIEKPVKVSNDTVFYDPKKFLDGTEKKVEDLLLKLPGISVNQSSGEIKYKGKSIETVNLEGDDLFGNSYSIGTKNISVDMVEEVQAIENYSANKLLKGIESTSKVALNLKLKKNKTDFSGDVILKNGFSNKYLYNNESTLIGISKKFKSFGVINLNNFGTDAEKIMSFSDEKISYQVNDKLSSSKLITETTTSINLPDKRTRFNNTKFGNFNVIYKLNSKISIKNNFFIINDKLELDDKTQSQFLLNDESEIETSLNNSIINRLNYYRFDTKVSYLSSEKTQFIFDFIVKNNFKESNIISIQNGSNLFNTIAKTDDLFIKGNLEFTYKLSEKKAFQWISLFSSNDIPQNFISKPNNSSITNNESANSNQSSNFNKSVLLNKALYLYRFKDLKISSSIGVLSEKNTFNSNLLEDGNEALGFSNRLIYLKSNLFGETNLNFKFYKFKINTQLSMNSFFQKIDDILLNDFETENDLAVNFNTIIEYEVNKHSQFYFNSIFDNKTPSEINLYRNYVITNVTTIQNSIQSLDLISMKDYSLGYKFNNLFKGFIIDLNFNYSSYSNYFLSNSIINQNFTSITLFQDSSEMINRSYTMLFEKQFKKLKTSVKHISSIAYSNYQNAIENFEIRENKGLNYNGNIFFSTYFNIPVNFENKISYNWFQFKNKESSPFERAAFNNSFKINFRPFENIIFSLNQDYYIPDKKPKLNFYFIDFTLQYNSKKIKWISFNFYGKNLSNTKTFKQIDNNDFSFTVYESNLIPRHFLLAMNFSF